LVFLQNHSRWLAATFAFIRHIRSARRLHGSFWKSPNGGKMLFCSRRVRPSEAAHSTPYEIDSEKNCMVLIFFRKPEGPSPPVQEPAPFPFDIVLRQR